MKINSIGKAKNWEYEAQGSPELGRGSELWYAEVELDGQKITMYFDVSADEIKEPDKITEWVLEQNPLDRRTR